MGERLHQDEVAIDAALVRALLAAQLPDLAALPLVEVRSTGTVNVLFRLGDELCVRLPRVAGWAPDLVAELEWLPRLAGQVSVAVPAPVAVGEPGPGYPFTWAVYRWIEGAVFEPQPGADDRPLAADLASFIVELRRTDTTGVRRSGRAPLAKLDEVTRAAIAASGDLVDVGAATAAWERALTTPPWDRTEVTWRHCDLLPPNLLVDGGRLAAVLDWGSAGIGDPAHDVIAAWSVLAAAGRVAFREALDVDDATWARARGVALHQALMIVPYYRRTNPGFVTMARRTITEVCADRS